MENDWERVKEQLFTPSIKDKRITSSSSSGTLSAQMTPLNKSRGGVPLIGGTSGSGIYPTLQIKAMDNKMIKFSRVIKTLNEQNRQHLQFPLISSFYNLIQNSSEEREIRKTEELLDCCELIRNMLHEEDNTLTKGIYYNKYLANSKELKREFIKGAKYFLEQQYLRMMKGQVSSNLRRANLGPIPSFKNLVKAYLQIKFNDSLPNEIEIIDNIPFWPTIYYSIRCGQWDTALDIVRNISDTRLHTFAVYLNEYISNEGRLQEQRWSDVIREYKLYMSTSRGNADPFKLLVFNILGKCDVSKSFATICNTTQDFIWLKLTMISESEDPIPPGFTSNDYSLSKLQNLLIEYGPDHFTKSGKNPLLYFQVLLMSQQFEKAIEYLCSVDGFTVESLHFAICLYYYGVLRPINSDLSTSIVFDFVRLLRNYVVQFSATDPITALNYYCVLHDVPSTLKSPIEGVTLRDQCIKDLLLECKDNNNSGLLGADFQVLYKILHFINLINKDWSNS